VACRLFPPFLPGAQAHKLFLCIAAPGPNTLVPRLSSSHTPPPPHHTPPGHNPHPSTTPTVPCIPVSLACPLEITKATPFCGHCPVPFEAFNFRPVTLCIDSPVAHQVPVHFWVDTRNLNLLSTLAFTQHVSGMYCMIGPFQTKCKADHPVGT
jgi:hypothetical protein